MKLKAFAAVSLLAFTAGSQSVLAASAVGSISQRVIRALSIYRESDLDFGTATNGDPAKVVPPSVRDTPANASFIVTGEPSASYAIVLPSDGDVTLTTGDAASLDRRIAVTSFRSYPENTGVLGPLGRQSLYVGATRAPIRDTQASGMYHGVFTVTVVY